jgi:hypothetical protein
MIGWKARHPIGSLPDILRYEADLPTGEFSHVELRPPSAPQQRV